MSRKSAVPWVKVCRSFVVLMLGFQVAGCQAQAKYKNGAMPPQMMEEDKQRMQARPAGAGAPGRPMAGAPMGGAPRGPMGGAPRGGAPMGGAPMGGAPGAPMGGAPMGAPR